MFILASLVGFVSLTSFKNFKEGRDFPTHDYKTTKFDSLFAVQVKNGKEVIKVNRKYKKELYWTWGQDILDFYVDIFPIYYKRAKDLVGFDKIKQMSLNEKCKFLCSGDVMYRIEKYTNESISEYFESIEISDYSWHGHTFNDKEDAAEYLGMLFFDLEMGRISEFVY